jgi:hypothetical protein
MTDSIISLLSLIALEVILGIDNIIFISILADKLPEKERNKVMVIAIVLDTGYVYPIHLEKKETITNLTKSVLATSYFLLTKNHILKETECWLLSIINLQNQRFYK